MKAKIVGQNFTVEVEGEPLDVGIVIGSVAAGNREPAKGPESLKPKAELDKPSLVKSKVKSAIKPVGKRRGRNPLTPSELAIIKTDYKNGRRPKLIAANLGRAASCIHKHVEDMISRGELERRKGHD